MEPAKAVKPKETFPPLGKAEADRLLKECRDRISGRVGSLLTSMLDAIEAELRVRMAVASTSEEKKVLQQALSVAVGDRRTVEVEFRTKFLELFDAYAKGEGRKKAEDQTGELSLLDDADMEENIIFKRLEGYVRESCNDDLFGIEQRLSVILDKEDVDDDTNPLSPAIFMEAFRSGCRSVLPDTQARMAFLRSVNKDACQNLVPVLSDANTHFSARVAMPERRVVSRGSVGRSDGGQGSRGASSDRGDTEQRPAPGNERDQWAGASNANTDSWPDNGDSYGSQAGWSGDGAGDFLARMNQMLSLRGGQVAMPQMMMPAGGFPVPNGIQGGALPPMTGYVPAAGAFPEMINSGVPMQGGGNLQPFLNMLGNMQQGIVPQALTASANVQVTPEALVAGTQNVVQALRSADEAASLNSMEAITIDVIAMIFDYIFNDEGIAPELKGVIGRLQIPLLKVALLDRQFFASRKHPARRLVDRMAELSNDCDTGSEAGMELFGRLDAMVTRIQQTFEENGRIFEESLVELEDFASAIDEQERAALQSVTEDIQAAEERAQKRRLIRDGVLARIEGESLPPVIRDFALNAWCRHLERIQQQTGQDSPEWRSAQQTMDDLVWSIRPKKHAAERELLVRRIPILVSSVKECMKAARSFPFEEERLLGELMKLHMAAMKAVPERAPVAAADETPANTPASAEAEGQAAEVEEADTYVPDLPATVQRGCWIEFTQEGALVKVRLSWISPQRSKFVFTHKGQQAFILSETELAEELHEKRARVVEAETMSLMDRAASKAFQALESAAPAVPS